MNKTGTEQPHAQVITEKHFSSVLSMVLWCNYSDVWLHLGAATQAIRADIVESLRRYVKLNKIFMFNCLHCCLLFSAVMLSFIMLSHSVLLGQHALPKVPLQLGLCRTRNCHLSKVHICKVHGETKGEIEFFFKVKQTIPA